MMKFCPKCGAIMRPRKEGEKVIFECSCGETVRGGSTEITERKEVPKKEEDVEVEVVDGEVETLPVTREECPKCGNDRAYYWLVQTRAGDEAETKFLKCTKCKHTWRDYS